MQAELRASVRADGRADGTKQSMRVAMGNNADYGLIGSVSHDLNHIARFLACLQREAALSLSIKFASCKLQSVWAESII